MIAINLLSWKDRMNPIELNLRINKKRKFTNILVVH